MVEGCVEYVTSLYNVHIFVYSLMEVTPIIHAKHNGAKEKGG